MIDIRQLNNRQVRDCSTFVAITLNERKHHHKCYFYLQIVYRMWRYQACLTVQQLLLALSWDVQLKEIRRRHISGQLWLETLKWQDHQSQYEQLTCITCWLVLPAKQSLVLMGQLRTVPPVLLSTSTVSFPLNCTFIDYYYTLWQYSIQTTM